MLNDLETGIGEALYIETSDQKYLYLMRVPFVWLV